MTGRSPLALLPLLGVLALGTALAAETPAEPTAVADPATSEGTASAPAATPASPAPALSEDQERARSEYNRELRTVEQDVNQLKERVFRSKATLQLLKELVLEGATLGSRFVLWHVNKMGPAYTLESVQYFLDGKNVYAKMDTSGALNQLREVKLLEQAMPPGTHNLQVNMVLRGNGFGVFSYLKTYSFKVQSSYTFSVEDGKATTVKVVANERGGPWRTFVDRPNVVYEEAAEKYTEPSGVTGRQP